MAEEKGKKMIGSYDIKVPEDTDVLLGYDVTANKVKNFKFSGIWTWLISKLKGSSISDLNTTNKTVIGAIKEVNTPTFTTATSRTNINSGESQSIIMGKIKKWLADLGTAAFCSVVNNLTTTAEGSVLDARQGKNLSDALTKLNTLMGSTDISAIGGGTLTGAISELNSKAFSIINLSKEFTSTNGNYAYTGLSITVPEFTMCLISIVISWMHIRPTGFILSSSDSECSTKTMSFKFEGYPTVATCITEPENTSRTYYVWAKCEGIGVNRASIFGCSCKTK